MLFRSNELIKINLELQGYEVIQSFNGTEGFALAKQESPELIVLDVMMPEVDGFTVAQRIRQSAEVADTPILMLTALSGLNDKVSGFNIGVDDYLTKPFEIDEVMQKIDFAPILEALPCFCVTSFEISNILPLKENLFGNIALILSAVASLLFFIFVSKDSKNGTILLLLISSALVSVLYPFVTFIPVKYLKFHLGIDIFYFISIFVSLTSNAIIAFSYYKTWDDLDAVALALFIISLVIAVIYFIILLNPKISTWANLKEERNADGTKAYVRPKYFALAYTEWLSFIFHMLSIILTLTIYSLGMTA